MTTFITGFPGFLGSALVSQLLTTDPGTELTCLIQSKYRTTAERRVSQLEAEHGVEGAISLVDGDITEPDLGLGDQSEAIQSETTEAIHLAALYDLGVSASLARRVNVDGTRHVVDFVEACPDLERFDYVSTCYVAGRYHGTFRADDLLVGQRFNNHYEASKFQAEVLVRAAMDRGLPTTIYRPGIVVGDSLTGETRKYDGPYQLIRFLLRQPRVAIVPVIGDPSKTELNVVPRDFVIEAIGELRRRSESLGETYQLANPDPPTIDRVLDLVGTATDRHLLRVPVPRSVLRGTLETVPGLAEMTGIQPELVDYFDLPTRFDASGVSDALDGSGVSCPPFENYVDTLVDFVRSNPDIGAGPMA